ncbi:Major facilitator superfamily domain [Phytophthora cactorum]|nr:Major facilitator superfamily domain [Phytophthora cactorum]
MHGCGTHQKANDANWLLENRAANRRPILVDHGGLGRRTAGSRIDGIRGRYKKADVASDVESGATSSPSATSTFSSSSAAADDDAYSMLSPPEKEKKAATALSNVQAVIHWFKSMRLQFGDGLLLQIFFVYFTQGIRSTLCSLGTSYYLNETLALHPAQSESLRATAAIPWIIKPLYGMLSDSVPIWGTRRKSYLLIFSTISAAAYFALSMPGLITTYESALVALVVASLGIAFCDVVIDGKVHCTRRSAVDTASMCATPQTKTSAVSNAAISAYPDTRQRSIMMHYKPSDPTNFDAN